MQPVKHLEFPDSSADNICQDYQCQICPTGSVRTEPTDDICCFEKEATHLLYIAQCEAHTGFLIHANIW